MNKTFIVLIPKTTKALNLNHYLLISLCNFAYKVVAKIMAKRLGRVVEKLVSPNQRAFVKGKWIAENSAIANEVIHKVRKHKGKKGLMVLKIDMKKVYDIMEWSFVIRLLKTWGFNESLCGLVRSCMKSVYFSLLLNGYISKTFKLSRGLRQGDLLSPFLFILGSEALTRLFRKEEDSGSFHRIKIHKNSPVITHLLYADDLLVMCQAGTEKPLLLKVVSTDIVAGQDMKQIWRNLISISQKTLLSKTEKGF